MHGLDELPDDRAHLIGPNRQLEIVEGGKPVVSKRRAHRLHLRLAAWIEGDVVRRDRGVGGDRGRDDLGLHTQAFAFRGDQQGVLLGDPEDAGQQHDEADHVGDENPAGEGLGEEAHDAGAR